LGLMTGKNQEKLSAAAIFSDNMVLQHGKPVPFWGTGGVEGSSVFVIWESKKIPYKKKQRSAEINGALRSLL